MNGPSTSEIIFLSVNHSITLIGKVWLMVMVLLRALILLLAGYPVYQDEQERFICNTIQPGCANVCYDLFAPVSLLRFWVAQLASVCLPCATFVCYVVHRVTSDLHRPGDDDDPSGGSTPGGGGEGEGRRWRRGGFAGAYALHLVLRTLLEAGFAAALHYHFGLSVPRRFLCQRPPCTTQVDCYVSRPSEKTAVLGTMQAAAALSLLLGALDLACCARRWAARWRRRRRRGGAAGRNRMVRAVYDEEERCFLSADAHHGDPHLGLQDQGRGAPVSPGGSRKSAGGKDSPGGGGALDSSQGPSCLMHSVPGSPLALPPGDPNSNNGNNGCSAPPPPPKEPPEAGGGSETALCPPEPAGTPRSFRVNKRSRLKPPPPRRDPPVGSLRDVPAATVCTRRVGQYTLVELTSGAEPLGNSAGPEKRSEWV